MKSITKKFLITFSVFAGLGAAVLGYLYFNKTLQRRLQDQAIRKIVKEIQPGLPFKIKEVSLDGLWSDILTGKAADLALKLEFPTEKLGPIFVRLDGPLVSERTDHDTYRTQYRPKIVLMGLQEKIQINAKIYGDLEIPLTGIEDLGIELDSPSIELKQLGLSLKDFKFVSKWTYLEDEISTWKTELSIKETAWKKDDSQSVQIDGIQVVSNGNADFFPPEMGDQIQTKVQAKSIAALWGSLYFDSKVDSFPILISANPNQKSFQLSLGQKAFGVFAEGIEKNIRLGVKIKSLEDLWGWISKGLSQSMPKPKFLKWLVKQGSASLDFQSDFDSAKVDFKINQLSFGNRNQAIAVEGLNLRLPFQIDRLQNSRAELATFEIKNVAYKKYQVQFFPLKFGWTLDSSGQGNLFFSEAPRMESDEFKFHMRKPKVSFRLPSPGQEKRPVEFFVKTGLELEPVMIQSLIDNACIPMKKKLPKETMAWIRLPQIEITHDKIQTEGNLHADFFKGFGNIQDPTVFDWQSEIPEIQTDIAWDHIRMDDLGNWLGTGPIYGFLRGHAKDLTIKGVIPIRYDFLSEIVPLDGETIPFSGKSLKNMVEAITNAQAGVSASTNKPVFMKMIEDLIYGNWFDYSVNHAGIRAKLQEDGFIQVRTTQPDDLKLPVGQHAFLSGRVVKFIMDTPRYPLIMDASAFYSYSGSIGLYLLQVGGVVDPKKNKNRNRNFDDDDSESENETEDENETDECIPKFFD